MKFQRFVNALLFIKDLVLVISYLLKINKKIQNDSPKFNIVGAISDISIVSDYTTHQ